MDELDLTFAESKATYEEIKAYVLGKYGLKVSSPYISQVKRKCGLDVGQNYNLSKKEDVKVPQCPPGVYYGENVPLFRRNGIARNAQLGNKYFKRIYEKRICVG